MPFTWKCDQFAVTAKAFHPWTLIWVLNETSEKLLRLPISTVPEWPSTLWFLSRSGFVTSLSFSLHLLFSNFKWDMMRYAKGLNLKWDMFRPFIQGLQPLAARSLFLKIFDLLKWHQAILCPVEDQCGLGQATLALLWKIWENLQKTKSNVSNEFALNEFNWFYKWPTLSCNPLATELRASACRHLQVNTTWFNLSQILRTLRLPRNCEQEQNKIGDILRKTNPKFCEHSPHLISLRNISTPNFDQWWVWLKTCELNTVFSLTFTVHTIYKCRTTNIAVGRWYFTNTIIAFRCTDLHQFSF